jgi:anti-sigma B factor antagonist
MSREHYPVLWIGQTAVVSLPAEIDITNVDQVREDLLSVLNQGAALLIADLSWTTFCDSAGVSALARGFRRAEASQSEIRLVVSTVAVQRVLALTGVDRLLHTYPSVAASLAASPDSAAQGDSAASRDSAAALGDNAFGGNAATTAVTDGGAA